MLLVLLLAFSARTFAQADDVARHRVNDLLAQLIRESATGFATRMGAPIKGGDDDEQRYATPAIDGLDSRSQYISVKNGLAFFNMRFKGHETVDFLFSSFRKLRNEHTNLNCDYNNVHPKNMYADRIDSFPGNDKPLLVGNFVYNEAHTVATLTIGPVFDSEGVLKKFYEDKRKAEDDKFANIHSGNAELDAMAAMKFFDGWGAMQDQIHNMYIYTADAGYNNTVGDAYTEKGQTRYRSPLWFNANEAYYLNDTTGNGMVLKLFFKYGEKYTTNMLGAIRGDFNYAYRYHPEYGKVRLIGTGSEAFLYMDRDGLATALYRFDTSAGAVYRGLTIIFVQTWKLKERIARNEEVLRNNAAITAQNNRDEAAYRNAPATQNKTAPHDYNAEDRARKEKLHQESTDYYNKIHPYTEGHQRDGNNNIIW